MLVNFLLLTLIIFFLYKTLDLWIYLFNNIKLVLMPFIISLILASLLRPIVLLFRKVKINNTLSIICTIILVLVIISVAIYFIIPIIYNQVSYFIININKFISSSRISDDLKEIFFDNNINIIKIVSKLSIKTISTGITTITKIIICLILTIAFLFSYDKIRNIIKIRVKNNKIFTFLSILEKEFFSYFKALFLIVIIEIIEYSFIYLIIGHPNYLLLGLLAGITSIIPVFGSLFTHGLALISSFSISKSLFIITIIICLIMPLIDNYIIDPKIYSKTNHIRLIEIIFAISLFSLLFGVLGLLIAIPLYITIKKYTNNFQLSFKSK